MGGVDGVGQKPVSLPEAAQPAAAETSSKTSKAEALFEAVRTFTTVIGNFVSKPVVQQPLSFKTPERVAQEVVKLLGTPARAKQLVSKLLREDPVFKKSNIMDVIEPHLKESTTARKVESIVHPDSDVETSVDSEEDEEDQMGDSSASSINLDEKEKRARDLLVGLLDRPDVKFAIGEDRFTQIQGRTPSAEVQKYRHGFNELANERVVIRTDKSGTKELILVASGRSQTPEQVNQKSQLAIKAAVDSGDANVLRQGKPVKRLDITMMDQSLKKSIGTRVLSTLKSIKGVALEDERSFVEEKRETVDGRHAGHQDGLVQHTYKGKTYHEAKPLVYNFVFSAEAGDLKNIQTAQKANCEHSRQLLNDYLTTYPAIIEKMSISKDTKDWLASIFQTIRTKLNASTSIGECLEEIENTIQVFASFDSPNEVEIINALKTIQSHLKAMKRLIEGPQNPPKGLSEEEKIAFLGKQSMELFLATTLLGREAGYIISLECKSGNDRTATACALVVAQQVFIKEYGYPPSELDSASDDFNHFRDLFVKAFKEMAPENLKYSRGVGKDGIPKVKVKSSPVFNYLVPKGSKERAILQGVVRIDSEKSKPSVK